MDQSKRDLMVTQYGKSEYLNGIARRQETALCDE